MTIWKLIGNDGLAIIISLCIVLASIRACDAEAQEDYITCSNGTEVIHIAYPGMCPVGYWQI